MSLQRLPTAGEVWAHRTGREYLIRGISNVGLASDDRFPLTVEYQALDLDYSKFSRPWSEFQQKFSYSRRLGTEPLADIVALDTAREIDQIPRQHGDAQYLAKVQLAVLAAGHRLIQLTGQ